MRIKHENIDILEDALSKESVIGDFSITDNLVKYLYHTYLESSFDIRNSPSAASRTRGYELQYEFVRRDLLKIRYKRNNNSVSGIKEGFVYAVSNPSYPDWIKIGSSIDVYERLNSYQTSSPFRDYELISYYYSIDRFAEERQVREQFEYNSEWCKVSKDNILILFKNRIEDNRIQITASEISHHMFKYWSRHERVIKATQPVEAISYFIKNTFDYFFPEIIDNQIKVKIKRDLETKRNWKVIKELGRYICKSKLYNFEFIVELNKDRKIESVNIKV